MAVNTDRPETMQSKPSTALPAKARWSEEGAPVCRRLGLLAEEFVDDADHLCRVVDEGHRRVSCEKDQAGVGDAGG